MIDVLSKSMREIDLSGLNKPIETVSVYVLIDRGEVVYVGKTSSLHYRLSFHAVGNGRHKPAKQFDRAFAIDVPCADALALEGALIRRFNPPLCFGSQNDESRDAEMLERFGLERDRLNRDAFIERRRLVFVESHARRAKGRNRSIDRAASRVAAFVEAA